MDCSNGSDALGGGQLVPILLGRVLDPAGHELGSPRAWAPHACLFGPLASPETAISCHLGNDYGFSVQE